MSVHEGLLATVTDQPDEDGPRLVYADFLEDQGDEASTARAEFIRLQIELARLSRSDPKGPPLRAREKELADRWAWEWAVPLHGHVYEWVFRRGFIDKVSSGLQCSAEEIRSTLRLAPIRHIRDDSQFTDLRGVVGALPDLARLTGLEFWGLYSFCDELMRTILTSPHLANLRRLILYSDRNGNVVEDEVMVEGLKSPYRANLRYLGVNIDDCWQGPSETVLRAMTESRYLRRVRKLKLSHSRLDPELVAQLLHAMPRLNRLDLHRCVATPLAWHMILDRARAGQFKWLRLCEAHVSERATQSPHAYGRELADMPEFREAFDTAPVRVDWDTEWILPMVAGCWKGYTWEDQRSREEAKFDQFLRARDFDGLESYFRSLCRRFRGEVVTARIDAIPFEPYTVQLEQDLRRVHLSEQATMILLDARLNVDLPAEGYVTTQEPSDDFNPHEQRLGGEILGRFTGPSFPHQPERLWQDEKNPLDPWSAPLFVKARLVAAVARAAAKAGLPIPLVLGPEQHRVW
jgi:uncharacterized protein (TIGR02996 family)